MISLAHIFFIIYIPAKIPGWAKKLAVLSSSLAFMIRTSLPVVCSITLVSGCRLLMLFVSKSWMLVPPWLLIPPAVVAPREERKIRNNFLKIFIHNCGINIESFLILQNKIIKKHTQKIGEEMRVRNVGKIKKQK